MVRRLAFLNLLWSSGFVPLCSHLQTTVLFADGYGILDKTLFTDNFVVIILVFDNSQLLGWGPPSWGSKSETNATQITRGEGREGGWWLADGTWNWQSHGQKNRKPWTLLHTWTVLSSRFLNETSQTGRKCTNREVILALHWAIQAIVSNRAFSRDVAAAMLEFQNKEMSAMMVYQTNPLGNEFYFYVDSFFCFSSPIWLLVTWVKTLFWQVTSMEFKCMASAMPVQ